eukprot:9503865-Pyramimonas_sp.AAC.2
MRGLRPPPALPARACHPLSTPLSFRLLAARSSRLALFCSSSPVLLLPLLTRPQCRSVIEDARLGGRGRASSTTTSDDNDDDANDDVDDDDGVDDDEVVGVSGVLENTDREVQERQNSLAEKVT